MLKDNLDKLSADEKAGIQDIVAKVQVTFDTTEDEAWRGVEALIFLLHMPKPEPKKERAYPAWLDNFRPDLDRQ